MDELALKLILAKKNDPKWVLTSPESQRLYQLKKRDPAYKGIVIEDLTDKPEWCDPKIYTASLQKLLKVAEEESPHIKAMYIEDAYGAAVQAMRIARPFDPSSAMGTDV